jgi:hypothetical protein
MLSEGLKTPQSKDKKKSYNMLHRDSNFYEFVVATKTTRTHIIHELKETTQQIHSALNSDQRQAHAIGEVRSRVAEKTDRIPLQNERISASMIRVVTLYLSHVPTLRHVKEPRICSKLRLAS